MWKHHQFYWTTELYILQISNHDIIIHKLSMAILQKIENLIWQEYKLCTYRMNLWVMSSIAIVWFSWRRWLLPLLLLVYPLSERHVPSHVLTAPDNTNVQTASLLYHIKYSNQNVPLCFTTCSIAISTHIFSPYHTTLFFIPTIYKIIFKETTKSSFCFTLCKHAFIKFQLHVFNPN